MNQTNITTKYYVNPACGGTTRPLMPMLGAGEALVGWNFSQGARCGVVYRSGVWFGDFAKGLKVVDATMTFYVARSQSTAQGNPLSGNVSCASQLQLATAIWMNNPDSPLALLGAPYLTLRANQPGDTERFGSLSISNGIYVSIDVTQAVQQWAAGNRPNFGFVLVPDHADFNGESGRCFSTYNGFTLTVDSR